MIKGLRVPSVEVAKRIADALEASLDYLVDDKAVITFDKQIVKRQKDIQALEDKDRENIFYALDGLIKAAKLKMF